MSAAKKTIGIIGGMGPLATSDLFSKIICMTDASCDAEHIHIIIDNMPQIPDRTAAILKGGESPLPELINSAERLRNAGADFLLMTCITAHCFFDELAKNIDIPLLNIIEETAKHLKKRSINKVVLLATDGTVQAGVFKSIFDNFGIELVYPCATAQNLLMDVIYKGVKAGAESFDVTLLNAELDSLTQEGAEAVILGCTELPLAARMYGINGNLIDPTDILARAAIEYAGYSVK